MRADEEALRRLDAEWVKAAQSKQVDAWVAFYSDDAALLPPNEAMATDKDSIRTSVSGLLGLPGLTISWQPTKVEVARGGDLAYLYGRYEVSFDEAPGKRTTDRGKIVEILEEAGPRQLEVHRRHLEFRSARRCTVDAILVKRVVRLFVSQCDRRMDRDRPPRRNQQAMIATSSSSAEIPA